MQVWLGFSQSLRACEAGLTLNVDVASTAFVQAQGAVEFVARAAGMRPDLLSNGLTGNQLRTATKAANNMQVCTLSTHPLTFMYVLKCLDRHNRQSSMKCYSISRNCACFGGGEKYGSGR